MSVVDLNHLFIIGIGAYASNPAQVCDALKIPRPRSCYGYGCRRFTRTFEYTEDLVRKIIDTVCRVIQENQKTEQDYEYNNPVAIASFAREALKKLDTASGKQFSPLFNDAVKRIYYLSTTRLLLKDEGAKEADAIRTRLSECLQETDPYWALRYMQDDFLHESYLSFLKPLFKNESRIYVMSMLKENIQSFREPIAKLFAAIPNPKTRYEVAKFLATTCGYVDIGDANLPEPKQRIELAIHCARRNNYNMNSVIGRLDEADLLELVKRVANCEAAVQKKISEAILKIGKIKDENIRFHLEMIVLKNYKPSEYNGNTYLEYLVETNISPQHRFELLCLAYHKFKKDDPKILEYKLKKYSAEKLAATFHPSRSLIAYLQSDNAKAVAEADQKDDTLTELYQDALKTSRKASAEKDEKEHKERATGPGSPEAVKWLGYHELHCQLHNVPKEAIAATQLLLKQILKFRHPIMRDNYTQWLLKNFYNSPGNLAQFTKMQHHAKDHGQLFLALLCPLGFKSEKDLMDAIKFFSSDHFAEFKLKKDAILSLYAIVSNEQLTSEEKAQFVMRVIKNRSQNDIPVVMRELQLASALVKIGYPKLVLTLDTAVKMETFIKSQFQKEFNLFHIANCGEKFEKTFGAKDPEALFVYHRSLQKLPESDSKKRLLQCLKQFIVSVLEGTYPQIRYSMVGNKHLETVFKNNEPLRKAWMAKGISGSLDAQMEKSPFPNVCEALKEPMRYTSGLHEVSDCVSAAAGRAESLKKEKTESLQKEIQNLLAKIKELGKEDATKDKRLELQKAINVCKFQIHLINFLDLELIKVPKNPEKMSAEKLATFAKDNADSFLKAFELPAYKEILDRCPMLKEAIAKLAQSIRRYYSPEAFKGWTMEESDDWKLLLHIGNYAGSCQKLDGNPDHNKCILGTLLDGKVKVVFVRNAEGKIIGRVNIELMWDDKEKKPILVQQLSYFDTGIPNEVIDAVDAAIAERAKELQLNLVMRPYLDERFKGKKIDEYPTYPNDIHSLSCPAPFFYSDAYRNAEGTGVSEGVYTLKKNNYATSEGFSMKLVQAFS